MVRCSANDAGEMNDRIRDVIAGTAKLSVPVAGIGDTDSPHALGLTSLTTVLLMLALEDAFDVEFPDNLLSAQTFSSVASIAAALKTIRPGLI